MERQLEITPVRRGEARMAALVVQVQMRDGAQIASAASRRPVHTAGEQPRVVQFEPVESDHFLLQLVALAQPRSPPVPVQVFTDDQLQLHVPCARRLDIEAGLAQRSAAELIAFALQIQIAAFGLDQVPELHARGRAGPPVQMRPMRRVAECEYERVHAQLRRLCGLQDQQQLPPDVLRIIVWKLLQIQDLGPELRHADLGHGGPDAPLLTLPPCADTRLRAHEHLLAGVVDAGPQAGQ